MKNPFNYRAGVAHIAFRQDDYYVWDCAVIKADGKYHMFSSHWEKERGFGNNWLTHSRIIHSVSEKPEGPFVFRNEVLTRRGKQYFDGMNTHNTCIRKYKDKYYLYYMGTTYEKEPQTPAENDAIWDHKRIGLAVSDNINGPFVRRDEPLLEARPGKWDATAITNPAVAILPDGRTYMIYKSRRSNKYPLQLGIAYADSPEGPYRRLSDDPIFSFDDAEFSIEDPYLWYDEKRKKFCLITKDDHRNGGVFIKEGGITGEWGAGFYAESDDCIHFEIPGDDPKVYSRTVTWPDGHVSTQCNLERPCVLFDENGKPTHIYCASGDGPAPFAFEGTTYIVCLTLEEKK